MNPSRLFLFTVNVFIYVFISFQLLKINLFVSVLGGLFFGIALNMWFFERQKINQIGKMFLESFKKNGGEKKSKTLGEQTVELNKMLETKYDEVEKRRKGNN